jgi:hypothetical protein
LKGKNGLHFWIDMGCGEMQSSPMAKSITVPFLRIKMIGVHIRQGCLYFVLANKRGAMRGGGAMRGEGGGMTSGDATTSRTRGGGGGGGGDDSGKDEGGGDGEGEGGSGKWQ